MKEREFKPYAVYRHFKNQKMYATVGISYPVDKRINAWQTVIKSRHTETGKSVYSHFISSSGRWEHECKDCDEPLVLYKCLCDDTPTWARPYDMFMSEVDKEKHPDSTQRYRLEEVPY